MDNTKNKLCMGCMADKISSGICPFCGYDDTEEFDSNYITPGTDLDSRYIIGRLERTNGEGAVYLGYDRDDKCPVWVKEYFPSNIASRDKESFLITPNTGCGAQYKALLSDFVELYNEVRRLGKTEPTIIVENMVGENNTIYIICKYIETLTFEEYLAARGGRISQKEATELLIPLLNCIDNMHIKGVIHRGLSPYTILVDEKEKLYVDGFALSATRTGGSELKAELFSGYSAPEQYLSTGWQGTWTDVYSLAAIFYRTISGVVPPKSTRANASDTMIKLRTLLPDVSKQLSDAVEHAMQSSTQNRSQTVATLISEIIAEDGVPKTEIFNVGRLPIQDSREFEVGYRDDFEPLKIDVDSASFSSGKDFGENTISTPVPEMFEYKRKTKYEFDDEIIEVSDEEEEESSVKKMPKRVMFGLIILGVLVGVVIAVFLSYKLGLTKDKPSKTTSTQGTEENSQVEESEVSEEATVNIAPDLVGKKRSSIEFNDEYTSIYTFSFKEEYSDKYDKGIIVEQVPAGGKEMPKKGGTIVLTVSKGNLQMEMPDLEGMEQEEALQLLAKTAEEMDIKFEDIKITQIKQYKLDAEVGHIIKTNPVSGTKFNPVEDEVDIYIAMETPASQSQQNPGGTSSKSGGINIPPPTKGPGGVDIAPVIPG